MLRTCHAALRRTLLSSSSAPFSPPPFHTTTRCFISVHPSSACAEVRLLPLLTDNYSYLLIDRHSQHATAVDPGEALPLLQAVKLLQQERGPSFTLSSILCTHKHTDHVGGNEELKQYFPGAKIIGTGYEDIPHVDVTVQHGQCFSLGSLRVQTIHTPCHTAGHVCFYVTPAGSSEEARSGGSGSDDEEEGEGNEGGDPILFSGDTLFAGGCGRFFEGTAEEMLRNMDTLGKLPLNTQMYCGHEYTLSNLAFLRSINFPPLSPLRRAIDTYHKRLVEIRGVGKPSLPSTIGDELKYNLFMKCREKDVQVALGCEESAVNTMRTLRELKNDFR